MGEDGTKPLGVARISFGASSTIQDIDRFIKFMQRYFLVSHEAIALALPSSSFSPVPGSLYSRPQVYLQNLVRCESNLGLLTCHHFDSNCDSSNKVLWCRKAHHSAFDTYWDHA